MHTLPHNFDSWSKALHGAFKRGFKAAQEHIDRDDCPYCDKRNSSGRLTWSRAFIRAWEDDYDWYNQELISEYYQEKKLERGIK